MAKLTQMPHQAIIDGFKGKVDFYEWRGIPCARKWPVWKPRISTPAEKSNQDDFAYINKLAGTLPVDVIDGFKLLAVSTPFTWKDLLVRGYMRGLWD
ncbi:hypothetical protein ES705_29750 [subsurface metagenome]